VATPAIVVYEVYKKIKRERGGELGKVWVAQMEKNRGVPIDQSLATWAGHFRFEVFFPRADSSFLANGPAVGVELLNSSSDFRNVPGVQILGANGIGTPLSRNALNAVSP